MVNKKTNKKSSKSELKDSQLLAAKKSDLPKGANDNLVDEISEDFDRFETWVIANGKYILAVCVILIIGVAVFFTVRQITESSRKAATQKLSNAEKVEDLEKVLKETSASVPGYDVAQLRLARQYAAAKKYDQAFAAYKAVADRKNEPYISNRARLDSAYIKELAGKYAEAAAIFALVADDSTVLMDQRAEAAYAAGRLFLLQKNTVSAKKYLSMMDPLKMTTPVSGQWASLAHAMLTRMPADKKTPAAPVKKAPAVKK